MTHSAHDQRASGSRVGKQHSGTPFHEGNFGVTRWGLAAVFSVAFLLAGTAQVSGQVPVVTVTDITIYEVDGECGEATFGVSLSADPGGTVNVPIVISDPAQATIDPETLPLTFDENNFAEPQEVTVIAALNDGPDTDFNGTITVFGPTGDAVINLTVIDLEGGNAIDITIGTVDNRPAEWGLMSTGDDQLVLSLGTLEQGEDCNPPEPTIYLFASTGGEPFPVYPLRDILSLTVLGDDGDDVISAAGMVPDFESDPPVLIPPLSIFGQGGDDTITGSEGNELIVGGIGSDTILATRGDDEINGDDPGDAGDPTDVDTLSYARNPGGNGMRSNLGAPLIQEELDFIGVGLDAVPPVGTVQTSSPIEDKDFDTDTIAEATQLPPDPPMSFVTSAFSIERVIGSAVDDIIIGGEVRGMQLNGGEGNDQILGGGGPDTILGGPGDDRIHGGSETPDLLAFCLREQFGSPDLEAIYNPNVPYSDLVSGGEGNDSLNGGAGNDWVVGGDDDDVVDGGLDSDLLWGSDGNDTLRGGFGNDVMVGGKGDDSYSGGVGFDLVDYQAAPAGITVNLGAATTEEVGIDAGTGTDGDGGTDSFPDETIEAIRGSFDPDRMAAYAEIGTVLLGGGDDDTLYGGIGQDFLFGEFGDDTIIGEGQVPYDLINNEDKGTSRDYIYGGVGNDTIRATSASDWIFGDGDELPDDDFNGVPDFELAEPCDAELRPDVICDELVITTPINPSLQDITLYISLSPLNGQPTQLDIPGPAGIDEIHGYPGSDIIIGGAGGDIIYGCALVDTDLLGEGSIFPESCLADAAATLPDILDSDIIFGDLHTPFLGSSGASVDILEPWTSPGPIGSDSIYGGPSADWVIGGAGADTIFGGGSFDTLWGDFQYDLDGDDVFDFDPDDLSVLPVDFFGFFVPAAMSDTIHGGLGVDPVRDPFEFEPDSSDFIVGGPGDDELYGDADADRIQGNSGFDVIVGGSGSAFGSLISNSQDGSLGDVVDYSTARVQGDMLEGEYGGVVVDLGFSNSVDAENPAPETELMNHCTGATFFLGQTCNDGDLALPGVSLVTERGTDILFGIDHVVGTQRDDLIFGTNDRAQDTEFNELGPLPNIATVDLTLAEPGAFGFNSVYDNTLFGLGGNDILMGRGGNDLLIGGDGNDLGCGDNDERCDELNVTDPFAREKGDNDLLAGLAGDDTLNANGGDDIVRGGFGGDTMSGGHGTDLLDYSDFDRPAYFASPETNDPEFKVPPVLVNLRISEDINVRDVEQVMDAVLGSIDHTLWRDVFNVQPLFSDAADNDDLPNPITCSETGIQCASTATDPGEINPETLEVLVPPALDTIINPTQDNASTSFNENLDRFERVMGTSGNDLIFAPDLSAVALADNEPPKTPVFTVVGGSGDDRIFGAYNAVNIVNYVFYGDGPLTAEILPPGVTLDDIKPGSDVLEGGLGDDLLYGGELGGCVNVPGGGEECPFGDVVSYAASPNPVSIDMSINTSQNTNGAGVDLIDGFRNLIGTAFSDVLLGNVTNNFMFGGEGNDMMFGNVGDDLLRGGGGQDTADYQFINLINPDQLGFNDLGNGNWIVFNDGQLFLPEFGNPAERYGRDELFDIENLLEPPDGGPIGGGGGGGGTVPSPVTVTVGEDQELQPGGSVLLSFSALGGVPPYTASWDPTEIVNTSVNPPRTDTVLFWDESTTFAEGEVVSAEAAPLSTTTFRVTVKDSLGTVDEEFVKVTVADTLDVSAGPDRLLVAGETATFDPVVSGGVQPYTYLWTSLSGDGAFVSSAAIARAQVAPEETTTYSLAVTDALGTTGFDTVEVRVATASDPNQGSFDNNPDLDQTDQNPSRPDEDMDDGDEDSGTDGDQGSDDDSGSPTPPQTTDDDADGESPPALCGAGMGSALMAANLLAFAMMRTRRRRF